jgi:endonuclease/exonuclease/phosphatase (EEP) superfamily protein YafD
MRPTLLVAAAAALVVGGIIRSAAAVVIASAAMGVNLIVLAPLYMDGPMAPAPGGDRLVVGHVNMQGRDLDVDELADALRERRPDVFVVLEPSTAVRALPGRRIGEYTVYAAPHSESVVALARTPVADAVHPTGHGLPDTSLTFGMTLADRTVRVLALHTISPLTPGRMTSRDDALRAAGRWAATNEGPEIVLGDLNATPWSDAVERLEDLGSLRNSADGFGLQATWPFIAGPVGIPIDELLHSADLTTVGRAAGPTFGSTHRSLWVTVALAAHG